MNMDYTLDILLNERVYCSTYENLNDPFEGQFKQIAEEFNKFPMKFPMKFENKKNKEIKDVGDVGRNIKICSFSNEHKDLKMWSFYADSHTGIVIEFEIDESHNIVPIKYINNLKEIDELNIDEKTAKRILSFKTNHWEFENEVRLFSNRNFYNVQNKITKIILGARIKDLHKKIIKEIAKDKYPIFETKLNDERLEVEIIES